MRLVPLGDRVVLKELNKIRNRSSGPGTGETAAGRGCCRRTGNRRGRKRSKDGSFRW